MKDGHVHMSVVSVAGIVAVVLLTNFVLHQLALRWGSSESESKQLWGKALVAGFAL